MSKLHFVAQSATMNILLRVTNVCSECYNDLKEDDDIYYDTEKYRYVCKKCYEHICALCEQGDDESHVDDSGLFTSIY